MAKLRNSDILKFSLILAVVIVVFHFFAKKQPDGKMANEMFDFFKRPMIWQDRYPPDFEIDLLDGHKFRLSDEIGKKIIILNFFATWCSPCKKEIPELNDFYAKHIKEPFVLIGIDADEKEKNVRQFIKEHEVRFPVGIDKDRVIQKLFTVRGYPTTVFIGMDGKVSIYESGPIMNADVAFDAAVKSNLELMRTGKGISKDEYLKRYAEQDKIEIEADEDSDEAENDDVLTGKARDLAEKMNCPCGCSRKVIDCSCKTAKDIKKALKERDYAAMSDSEIIKELNREFCKQDD